MNRVPLHSPVTFTHLPVGEQHPYEALPYERYPRYPMAGEEVELYLLINQSAADWELYCDWNFSNQEQCFTLPAIRTDTNEGSSYWKVSLPAFKGGDVIEYRFRAKNSLHQAVSDLFRFEVDNIIHTQRLIFWTLNQNTLKVVFETTQADLYLHLTLVTDQNLTVDCFVDVQKASIFERVMSKESRVLEMEGLRFTIIPELNRIQIERLSDHMLIELIDDISFRVNPNGQIQSIHIGSISPDHEAFWGFGERFNALDQRGNCLDNHVYGQYTNQGKRTYIPIPFFISSRGYGVWIKSDRQIHFDMACNQHDRWIANCATDGEDSLHLLLFLQEQPLDIIRAFSSYSGKPKLPPSWVFGLWMSSNDWNSQAEVNRQVKLSHQHRIPVSVMVLEAWSDEINFYTWNDSTYKLRPSYEAYHYEDFQFPKHGRWPDPKNMISELHKDGIRLVLWQIPVLKKGNPHENLDERQASADQAYAVDQSFVVKKNDGAPHRIEPHSPWFAGSLVNDFSHPSASQWWKNKRRYLLEEMGVDGFKTDGGEHIWDQETVFFDQSHGDKGINRYPLHYLKSYSELLDETRGEDHVLFSRAGYSGVQSLSTHWAGDERSTWSAFRASINAMLNASISGIAFIGWDIAGFAGPIPESDLYLRATAFSAFCPIMQFHSDTNNRQKPCRDRTPWNIQEQNGDQDVISVFRFYTNVRMNILPYLLRQAFISHQTGLPLMRSIVLSDPTDPMCRDFPWQYQFGEDLFIAPVVKPDQTLWPVYLPVGRWCDFWTGTQYQGGQTITMNVDDWGIPIFQKQGSLIALNLGDELKLGSSVGNDTQNWKHLVLQIFPEEGMDFQFNPLIPADQLLIAAHQKDGQFSLRINSQIPAFYLRIFGEKPASIWIDGVNVGSLEGSADTNQVAYYYENELHANIFVVNGIQTNLEIVVMN